jgi:hypothetical protein
MRGETLSGLIHVADWYATFSEAAGLGAAAGGRWMCACANRRVRTVRTVVCRPCEPSCVHRANRRVRAVQVLYYSACACVFADPACTHKSQLYFNDFYLSTRALTLHVPTHALILHTYQLMLHPYTYQLMLLPYTYQLVL